jgi:hypothetical protein
MTVKSINNRQIQKALQTYETKHGIVEALFRVRDIFSDSTNKFLSYFKNTNGVTQAKISTICEKVGISRSTYHNIVKPEIEELMGEPIIVRKKARTKLDHSRTKRVRASEYKIFIPLEKINFLADRFEKKEIAELQAFREEISAIDESESESLRESESNREIPSESKADEDFSRDEINSFRENLSEKDFNKLNINSLFVVKNFGKIKIKNAVKNYLNTFPLFRDFMSWTESKRYEIAKTIQLAIIKTKTDIQEKKPQYMIKNAIARFMSEYAEKPKSEFLRLLYTFVFNSLKNDDQDDSETIEDHSEDKPSQEPTLSSPAAEYYAAFPTRQSETWDALKPTFRRLQAEKMSDEEFEKKKADIERMLKQLHGEDQEIADKPKTLDEYREQNRERIQDLDDLAVF